MVAGRCRVGVRRADGGCLKSSYGLRTKRFGGQVWHSRRHIVFSTISILSIMCWSAEVSLNTYLFSTFACFFAFFNGIIPLQSVFFLQSFMMIQLVEFFIWSKTFSNRAISQFGLFVILLQPIFAILCVETYKKYIPHLLAVYFAFLLILFTLVKPWSSINFKSAPGPNGHLSWYWLDFPRWAIITWLAFLVVRFVIDKEWLNAAFIIVTFTTSYIMFNKTLTWGSFWCWIANVIAFYLVLKVFWKDICIKKNN